MSGIINKVKEAVDPKSHHSFTTHPQGTYTGTTGNTGIGSTVVPEGTYGPHSSRIANTLDPRVDSDGDHRAAGMTGAGYSNTTTTGTTGFGATMHNTHGTQGVNGLGTTGLGATSNTSDVPSGTYGPHSSRVANILDPRVDSDLDGRAGGFGSSHNIAGTHGAAGTHGVAGTAGMQSGPAPHTAGPHKSDILNKLDPRVDSKQVGI